MYRVPTFLPDLPCFGPRIARFTCFGPRIARFTYLAPEITLLAPEITLLAPEITLLAPENHLFSDPCIYGDLPGKPNGVVYMQFCKK